MRERERERERGEREMNLHIDTKSANIKAFYLCTSKSMTSAKVPDLVEKTSLEHPLMR